MRLESSRRFLSTLLLDVARSGTAPAALRALPARARSTELAPIYLLSMPASGSTWVGAMLGHLPTHSFVHEIKLQRGRWVHLWRALASNPRGSGDRWMIRAVLASVQLARLAGMPRYAARHPGRPELAEAWNVPPGGWTVAALRRQNVVDTAGQAMHLAGLYRTAFPRAALLYLTRDPREVVASALYRKPFDAGLDELVLEYRRQYFYFRANCDAYHVVLTRYEDWRTDARAELRRVADLANLALDDAVIEEAVLRHDASRIRAGSVPKAGNLSTNERTWEDMLSDDEIAVIERVLGDVIDDLGYRSDSRSRAPSARTPDRTSVRQSIPAVNRAPV